MKASKYLASMLVALFCLASSLSSGKTLEFYYIAHDHHERALTELLDQVRRTARYNDGRTVIFFLANGNNSLRVLVSPEDEDAYTRFRETLNDQNSHNVYPSEDRQIILDMLSEGRFIPTKGFDAYERTVFNFYVNSSFIVQDYCDALIGSLYWDMELSNLPKGRLEINIFYPEGEKIDEKKLFGRKNLIANFPVLVDTF